MDTLTPQDQLDELRRKIGAKELLDYEETRLAHRLSIHVPKELQTVDPPEPPPDPGGEFSGERPRDGSEGPPEPDDPLRVLLNDDHPAARLLAARVLRLETWARAVTDDVRRASNAQLTDLDSTIV